MCLALRDHPGTNLPRLPAPRLGREGGVLVWFVAKLLHNSPVSTARIFSIYANVTLEERALALPRRFALIRADYVDIP